MALYPIKGIQAGTGPNGEIPVRREIDEWWFSSAKNDVNQRSLFILALINFQKRGLDEWDDLGYFAVAGIHGFPVIAWPKSNEGGGVYCVHGQYTFNTWHTPYVLLFEQRIYEEMRELIPKEFAAEDQEELVHAADSWRFPFWDWAKRKPDWDDSNPDAPVNQSPGIGPNVPFACTQKKVPVRTKLGEATMVNNPLYQFGVPKTFSDMGVTDFDGSPWVGAVQVTSRRPKLPGGKMDMNTWNNLSPEDMNSYVKGLHQDFREVAAQMRGSVNPIEGEGISIPYFANSLPEGVYRLFASIDEHGEPVADYEQFASTAYKYGQQVLAYPSMEALHNNVHSFVGGGGYMSFPFASSFDPIFWLFHAQCDRLLAIWQELFRSRYEKWLLHDSDSPFGPNAALTPFLDADLKPYTSKTCSYKHKEFNYTYPELQSWKFADKESFHASIKADIERLYSTTSKAALSLDSNKKIATAQMQAMKSGNLAVEYFPPQVAAMAPPEVKESASTFGAQAVLASVSGEDFGIAPEQTWRHHDYVVNVVYERFALNGTAYSITFFLGDVPVRDSPDGEVSSRGDYDFKTDTSAISTVYNFVSPLGNRNNDGTTTSSDPACANCSRQAEEHVLLAGRVILTDYLIERIAQKVELRGLTLKSLERDEVVEYLKKNLHWRITDKHNDIIPKEQMPSLKISVAMGTATHYSDASRHSVYSNYETLWEVTQGRLGGAAPGDI